jgi:3,4-dihydroxy 2-butanone 4-phosphate synthase/GTP cyclohydrolase II
VPSGENLSSIEDIINDARNGRMFILVDDEERENEGDLIIPAQMATPETVNFMAKHGRGLICLSLSSERVKELDLPPMARQNESRHETAFTVSIEAREGISTGISASDRARSIAVAIDPTKGKDDIVCPGHVFPLEARAGGVLVRTGHTEAAVDVSRLAGLSPAAVICEVMNDDGTMARLPELVKFANHHGLKIATIADLIAYRLRYDSIIERTLETTLDSAYGGEFRMIVYVNTVSYAEHVALVKGDLSAGGPVLVRMHRLNILEDVLGDDVSGKAHYLHRAMEAIAEDGRGVVVLIREPRPTSLSDLVRDGLEKGKKGVGELREYGIGAQILLDLGVKEMVLLSNTKRTTPRTRIVSLEGYGLSVVGRHSIGNGDSEDG